MRRTSFLQRAAVLAAALAVTACTGPAQTPTSEPELAADARPEGPEPSDRSEPSDDPAGVVTLAFAGDMHFQLHLAALLEDGSPGLGPMSSVLSNADVAMVNLESAITERGTPEAKEIEAPDQRYWFRAPATALDFLADSGVDVVTMGNNHGADYGPVGLRDTLRAAARGPVAVVGVGRNRKDAFAPHRVTVGETDLAFLAADASPREGSSNVWEAGPSTPGVAAARSGQPRVLLDAVRQASRDADVVVVYLHWGAEGESCPTPMQRTAAQALAAAGADVVVGSHAHVLLGSGWLGDTYVNYGLGNFLWYHNSQTDTGVLELRIKDGEVVSDAWRPAEIQVWGTPMPVFGAARDQAVADWRQGGGCAGLAPAPAEQPAAGFEASVHRIGPALQQRMASSHGDRCPVAWRDLRLLRLTHVGFDGRDHRGELVVAAPYARPVTGVFRKLYDARWPIRRMRTVDAYGGNDDRSMAANNTSGYNCRPVAGSDQWSAHAFGQAIDLNPVQNPYLTAAGTSPVAGRRFADIARDADAAVPTGVIRADDVVVRAFAAIGWEWGGVWAEPDYQHFVRRGSP
ncbi:MAG: CapA family protein [Nocardioides sp.]